MLISVLGGKGALKKAVIFALGGILLLILLLLGLICLWTACWRTVVSFFWYLSAAIAAHRAAQMALAPTARIFPTCSAVRRRRLQRSVEGSDRIGYFSASWSMSFGVHWPVQARHPSWNPLPVGFATSLSASASRSSSLVRFLSLRRSVI